MRRLITAFIAIIIIAVAASVAFILTREKRVKTQLGWIGCVTTFAGDGTPMFRDAAAPRQAAFSDPFGVAINRDGVIYVSDAGETNRIRRISPDGAVTTLAGSTEGYADGVGPNASFNSPSGLAVDIHGNIYVADTANNRIRAISPEGIVSTIAGDGTAGYRDGPAAEARFDSPVAVAVDPHFNVFVADTYNANARWSSSNTASDLSK
jgi:sugar lactone lactonase YvrE